MGTAIRTSEIFKHSVACSSCRDDYLFTLKAIADLPQLKCPGCGNPINLSDHGYRALVNEIRDTIRSIEQ